MLEFSKDTPCVAAVIPAMDKMHTELSAAAENVEYSPALQAALSLGKTILDKYYSLTDDSEVYHIAMGVYIILIVGKLWCLLIYYYIYLVLHPKHKLKYFEKQDWDKNWIKTAEDIVWEEFKRHYEEYIPHKQPAKTSQSSKKKVSKYIIFILFFDSKSSQSWNDDTDDSESSSSSSSDEEDFVEELDRYLLSGHIKKVKDPLQWWNDNQGSYPRLSRMAKDYLTIPGQFFLAINSHQHWFIKFI